MDDISGVNRTEYSFDNDTWITYTTPFTVLADGHTIVYYRSTDKVGNVETTITETIKIDRTPPSGSIIINNGDAYTTSNSVMLTSIAADVPSGISQVRFRNDGVWDTEQWETHTLNKMWTLTSGDGTKTLWVQYMDNAGLTSSNYQDSIVLDTNKPRADAGDDQTVNEDTLLTFDASASTDENEIASYTWNLTDTTPQNLDGKNPLYTFDTPGIYKITLNVTDGAGNWATDTVVVRVLDITEPVANAGQNQTTKVDETVIFHADGSTDNLGIASYEWNFGDGATGTGLTVNHIYKNPGSYTVTLTAKDTAGNSDVDSITVTVVDTEDFPVWIIGVVTMVGAVVTVAFFYARAHRVRAQMNCDSQQSRARERSCD